MHLFLQPLCRSRLTLPILQRFLNVKVEIREEEIFLDFTDNPDQVAGATNLIESGLRACIYFCLKCIVDPALPPNGGYYRAIKYAVKSGTVVCCKEPAAVAGRTDTAQRVCDLIFGAMAKLVPHRVMAGTNGAITAIVFSGSEPDSGKPYVYLETVGGGSGARFCSDGLDAVQVNMTNTSNLPIECMELEYPLMVDKYCLIRDSGGAGEYRGGMGIEKDIRILKGDCVFSVKADRQIVPPWGLYGGKEGMAGKIIINPDSDNPTVLNSKKSNVLLPEGTILSCRTPGSGGYGDPAKRDKAKIIHDIEQGFISKRSAMENYGLTEEELAHIKELV